MAKYSKKILSPNLRREMLARFARAIVDLQNEEEAVAFLQDLLSKQESEMLAKRLAIADQLLAGARYFDIERELKVSAPTIARVNVWLQTSGAGYQLVHDRQKSTKSPPPRLRKRATIYNWPEFLLDEVIHGASRRQRARIEKIWSQLDTKSDLYKEMEPYLRNYV